ncbi:DUF4116 domain-containing protein [Patescibacteria group bacterium]|nr:DUF4116 domain-containing protein [Patescibacteria group bacterium]
MSTKKYLTIIILVLLLVSVSAYLVTNKVKNRTPKDNFVIEYVNDVLESHDPILSKVERDVIGSQGRINLIENPTDEHVFEILRRHPDSYVRRNDPFSKTGNIYTKAFTYIKNPTEEQKLRAISLNPHVLEHIKDPTEEMMLKAVSIDGNAIQWLDYQPNLEVMLAAVRQKPSSVRYIYGKPPEEVLIEAVKNEGKVLGKIREPNEAVMFAAIDSDLEAFEAIENPSEAIIIEKEFVEQILVDQNYIQTLANPTEEELLHIVSIDPLSVRFIDNPTEALQLVALGRNWMVGGMIDNLTTKAVELYESSKNEADIRYEKCLEERNEEYKNAEYVPGELLVSFVSNTRTADQKAVIDQLFFEIKEPFRSINGFILINVKDLPTAVCELEKNPLVKNASPNFIAHFF